MSDPLSNSEIQDVLSSIRRLVSEDRRARETREPDVPAGDPAVGKLILTEAHRVEATDEVLVESLEAAAIDVPSQADLNGAAAPDEISFPGMGEAMAYEELPPGVRPASALADDLASLESTIAELEAAVAGIGAEFEPDGSEVRQKDDDPVTRQLESAFDEGFVVDTGGPVRVEPMETFLDEPVTGSAVMPDAAAPPADDGSEEEAAVAKIEPALTPSPDEIAFLRSGSAARRPDWQVISGGEAIASPGVGLMGRLHLRPAADAEPEAEVATGPAEEVTCDEDSAGSGPPDAAAEEIEASAPDMSGVEVGAGEDGRLDIPLDPDAEAAAAWAGSAEEATPLADEAAATEWIEGADSVLAGEADPVGIPADLETPLLSAAAGIAGAAADMAEETEEADVDLFASGEEAVIDMEMLRELIVQVLREELQGSLGERITRNVRKLVRQEIARALESNKFE